MIIIDMMLFFVVVFFQKSSAVNVSKCVCMWEKVVSSKFHQNLFPTSDLLLISEMVTMVSLKGFERAPSTNKIYNFLTLK